MRFSTVILTASLFAGNAFAAQDETQLHVGFSPAFENALLQEVGPVAFEAFKAPDCNFLKCGLVIAKSGACIAGCMLTEGGVACIANCVSLSDLCPCVDCLPVPVKDGLHSLGICSDELKSKLAGRVYLGVATAEEKQLAEKMGITKETFPLAC